MEERASWDPELAPPLFMTDMLGQIRPGREPKRRRASAVARICSSTRRATELIAVLNFEF